MADIPTALSRALEAAFRNELGAMAAIWHADSEALRSLLRQRAERVLNKLPVGRQDRSTQRRATLAFRLLELEADAFDPRLDPVLGCALEFVTTEHARQFGAELLGALDLLPQERRARLRTTLAPNAFMPPQTFSALPVEAFFPGLEPEIAAHLHATLIAGLAGRTAGDVPVAALIEAICRITGLTELPDPYEPPLRRYLAEFLRNRSQYQWYHLNGLYEATLRYLPTPRLEALLLSLEASPWEFFHLCPTPPIFDRIASDLALPGTPAHGEHVMKGLVRFGAAIVPLLVEHLPSGRAMRRLPLHRLVIASATDDQLDLLLPLYRDLDEAWDRDDLLSRLRRAPIPPLAHALHQTRPDLDDPTRQALAQLIAWRARHEDVTALIDAMAPEDDITRAALADARRHLATPPAVISPEALCLFVGAEVPDDLTESIELAQLRALYATLPHDTTYPTPAELPLRYVASEQTHQYHVQGRYHAIDTALAALTRHPEGAVLAWAWVTSHPAAQVTNTLGMALHTLGATAMEVTARRLLEAPLPTAPETTLYTWLLGRQVAASDTALHLRLIERGGKLSQELAATALAATTDPPVETLAGLLTHGQASTRAAAARALEKIGPPALPALPALQTAARAERTKAAREALQSAVTAIDPRRDDPRDRPVELGAWSRVEDLNARDLMTELRDLLYEEPAPHHWMRTWDLLARLDLLGMAEPGVDYVTTHTAGRWPDPDHLTPWGWTTHTVFSRLIPTAKDDAPPFLPIAALYTPQRAAMLADLLPILEKGMRARRFQPDLVDTFLRAVHAGWRFCEQHHLPLHQLEIAVDGGSLRRGYIGQSTASTRLELWHGFGAMLSRAPARRETEAGPAGLRYAQVTVPARHGLRDAFPMKPRQRVLDILPMLDLDAAPR